MKHAAILVAVLCVSCSLALTVDEANCLGEHANKPNCARVQCAQHTHCDTCTKDLRCGWCASEHTCIPGVAAGPTKANCTTWDYAFCSSLPCSSHESCDSCASDPICGWCATSNMCTEGSPRGPIFMACIKRDWLYDQPMCPKKPSNCQCPLPNGDCPTKSECDRNNHIGHHIKTLDDLDPRSIEEDKWYDAVADQIPVDLIPPPLATAAPEPEPQPTPAQVVPQPGSEINYEAAQVEDGFMPTNAAEVHEQQNESA